MNIETFLQRFEHFGVNLGLGRIKQLLERLGNPHDSVPIIHVAGTNGKGSVCAYLSSVLMQAGYCVGRYISPHLIDWTERICINEQPISESDFLQVLQQVNLQIREDEPSPTQFEVITAAAWLYFAQQQVDVAILEVGLGGRLDATNVCEHPLVSVITSISLEHRQQLGPTVAHIAAEKAGILKPLCPAVVGQLPAEAKVVVKQRSDELGCPVTWVDPAIWVRENVTPVPIASYHGIEYPLPLCGQMQLMNSALAIATVQILRQQGWNISADALWQGMANTRWPGRLQWVTWREHRLLIDGAHNPAAAEVLRQYVDSVTDQPVSWVMGMLATKDHADIFKVLLRPGDRLYLVPVPDSNFAEPTTLATLAETLCPQLNYCQAYSDLIPALEAAVTDANPMRILCGSLYLVGHFLKLIG